MNHYKNGLLASALLATWGLVGCAGSKGTSGRVSLVNITVEPSGVNCATGGKKIQYGIDSNGNGQLDVVEVMGTSYFCSGGQNGAIGTTGPIGQTGAIGVTGVAGVAGARGAMGVTGGNGVTPLVVVSSEATGINCVTSGQKLESGIDSNGNGLLDSAEITATSYLCNGVAGASGPVGATGTTGASAPAVLVSMTSEPSGSHCPAGGQKMQSGLDANGNDVLDSAEISATSYACNGAAAADAGLNALISTTVEPTGATCAYGGQKVQQGLDGNRNGELEAAEVRSTSYICNGAPGSPGSSGSQGPKGTTGATGATGARDSPETDYSTAW